MKKNKWFKESEFDCKCGKCKRPANVPSDELVEILCEIREFFNAPVVINSGYRCATHNAKVGGAASSQHTKGSAVDIVVRGVPTRELHAYVLEKYGERELGIAVKINHQNPLGGFVHIDTRGRKARWNYA